MTMATAAIGPVAAPRRCLLAVPLSFYSFGKTLQQEFERQGFEVRLINDEYPASLLGKLLGRLRRPRLLRAITARRYRELLPATERFEVCLVVKGRGLGDDSIAYLRSIADRVIAYNFDSFGFHPSSLDWYRSVDAFCTFDIADAAAHGLPLVHLFSALPADAGAVGEKRFDLSLLMKNHSQRLAYADAVLSALPGLSSFTYIYEPNLFSFLIHFARYPRLYCKHWRNIHFKPLPYADFLRMLAASRITVDYAHPSQSGITIRCFEALSVGTHLITNNPRTASCDWFDGLAVAHYRPGDPAAALLSQVRTALDRPAIQRRRSVAQFVQDLLNAPNTRTADAVPQAQPGNTT